MYILLLLLLAVLVSIVTVLALLGKSSPRPVSASLAKQGADGYVAHEAAQAAFMVGHSSQLAMLGVESALPFLCPYDDQEVATQS